MKKVKLMLVSLSVLAVVGGALAFKAKSGQQFCTAPYSGSCPANCPTPAQFKDASNPIFLCSTPTTDNASSPCVKNGATLPCGASTLTSIE